MPHSPQVSYTEQSLWTNLSHKAVRFGPSYSSHATLHGSFQDACSQFLVLLDAWVTESHSSGFVPSALSPGSSKCACCTEPWGAHTQREKDRWQQTCEPLKRSQSGYSSSLVAGVCAQRSGNRWKSPGCQLRCWRFSKLGPPARERAAVLLLSPSSLGSEWNKSLGKSLFSLVSAPLGAKQLCWTF